MKLLIADDEKDLANALAVILQHARYLTDVVFNGQDALDYALSGSYDALILDVMMPGLDGFTIVEKLRAGGEDVPVLLLTAKDSVDDKVRGLKAGADDYLSKPFAMEELLARVEALLRRPRVFRKPEVGRAGLSLNRENAVLTCDGGRAELTNKELQLMELFLMHPGQVFSKEQLMERIWGEESEAESNVVFTNISSLRRKLEGLQAPVKIRNQRGLGYSLEEET